MGIVHLKSDLIHADDVAVAQPDFVVKHAAVHMVAHIVARGFGQVYAEHAFVFVGALFPQLVHALQHIRHPAHLPFAVSHLQAGEAQEHAREHEIAHGTHRIGKGDGGAHRKRRVRRSGRHLGRRPDVHVDDRTSLFTSREERIPETVGIVHGRQPQMIRVLRESDRIAALVGAAADFLCGQLGIPERHHRERDEPALSVALAPLVYHPVVVGLHAEQGEVFVFTLQERLPAETRQHIRKADRRLHMVGVHVFQAFLLLPAAWADFVKCHRSERERLKSDGRRELRKRIDEVVIEPPVAPLPVGVAFLVAEDAAFKVEGRPVALHARAAVVILARDAIQPQIGRLHDMVVH